MEIADLYRRSELSAAGYSGDEVRRMVRRGELTRVRRGTYLLGAAPDDTLDRHAAAAAATMDRLAGGTVASHVTAAVLHGLPVWQVRLDRVHATRSRRTGGRSGACVVLHSASLAADEIVVACGLPATSVARTVVDLARTEPFEATVVLADAAVAAALVTPDELAAALSRAAGRPGAPQARRVIGFADGRSESVGESRSRVAILRAGLPAPIPQWEVIGRDGRLVARTDFGWPERATVGEFDGKIKYGRLLRPGQTAGDAVFEEKRREDAIRDEDLGVVRWTWDDLVDFAPTAARLRARFRPR